MAGKAKDLASAPGPNSRVKSTTLVRSEEQEAALNKLIEDWKTKCEDPLRKNVLHVNWGRGQLAANALSAAGAVKFGPLTLDYLASRLAVKDSAIKQAHAFFLRVSKQQLDEILKAKNTPPWRRIAQALSIKDDNVFWKFITDMLSESLDTSAFDEKLRKLLEKGPAAPRKPKQFGEMLSNIRAEIVTFGQRVDWVPKMYPALQAMKAEERAAMKDELADTAEKLQALVRRIQSVLDDCKIITE